MAKSTPLGVQNQLDSALFGYKDQASAVKATHSAAHKAIREDATLSDIGKRERFEALATVTRGKLDAIKADQVSYVSGLKTSLEKELRGSQPSDANSVLLRRDAYGRATKITDNAEAMGVLREAVASGDDSMAHAVGARARQQLWGDVHDVYKESFAGTAGVAEALTYVDEVTTGLAYNVSNSATYAMPLD